MILLPISQEVYGHSDFFFNMRGAGGGDIILNIAGSVQPPMRLSLIFKDGGDDITLNIAESVHPPVILFP